MSFFSKTTCPNCQMNKTFSDGTKIKMCDNCTKHGYDYEMFKLPDGKVFLVVYMKAPKH